VKQALVEGLLVEVGDSLRLPAHEVAFSPVEEERVTQLLAAFRASPYSTPSWAEAETIVGEAILEALIQRGDLVRLSESVLYLGETYREVVERVLDHIRKEGSITVAQVRDLFGTSRKYALALMEHLDQERVTRRMGDERVLA
jgi:selenocysteine-specific elongation factor